jgi:enamine deaminase RidA (YjgF/YER057c/UK114 family)
MIPPSLAHHGPVRMSSIAHEGWTEFHLCAPSLRDLTNFTQRTGATLLTADLFGGTPPPVLPACAVTVAQGRAPIGGWQAVAVSGVTPQWIKDGERVVGAWFEDAVAKYCWLGGLVPTRTEASREAQAEEMFVTIERLLQGVGLSFRHVVRTWFYLREILAWYGEFNRVRNDFFRARHLFDGVVPASTGVGAANPAGAAVIAKAFAVQAKHPALYVRPVVSPLQCAALEYGSAFSRAVEVVHGTRRQLFISGTASIEPGGQTAHVGDVAQQVALTMDVARAILELRHMDWRHATRALAYFRHPADLPAWETYCRQQRLPPLPVVLTQCDVCRDDLLFELELDAAIAPGQATSHATK